MNTGKNIGYKNSLKGQEKKADITGERRRL